MRRIWILCMLMLCLFSASAEDALFPDTKILEESSLNGVKTSVLELPSGEQLRLTSDGQSGEALSLMTILPAPAHGELSQNREQVQAAVRESYPDARVFSTDVVEDGRRLLIFGSAYCGSVTVRGGMIVSRELEFAEMLRDERLTMDGAMRLLRLLRPQAEFYDLELDEDDGYILYEGEAWINGAEYEFELDAYSGRLLEWERD